MNRSAVIILPFLFLIFLAHDRLVSQPAWQLLDGPYGSSGITILGHDSARTVYAATSFALFRSFDYGATWSITDLRGVPVNGMSVASDGTVYVISEDCRIYKSGDGGESWSRVEGTAPERSGKDILVLPNGTLLIIASSQFGTAVPAHIYRSTDDGLNWTRIYFTAREFLSLQYLSNRVFAVTDGVTGGGIYFSDDEGTTWGYGRGASARSRIVQDAQGRLYAGSQTRSLTDGIFMSTDYGDNWEHVADSIESDHLIMLPSGRLIASVKSTTVNSEGIYYSDDQGKGWRMMTPDLSFHSFILASDGTLIGGNLEPGSSYLREGETEWRMGLEGVIGIPDAHCAAAANGNMLVSTAARQFFLSDDNGSTWQEFTDINLPLSKGWFDQLIRADWDDIYAVQSGTDSLFRSTDHGRTWFRTGITCSWFALGSDGVILAVEPEDLGADSLLLSVDSGRTWKTLSTDIPEVYRISADPSSGSFYGEFYDPPYERRTTDNGLTWNEIGFPQERLRNGQLRVNPSTGTLFYYGEDRADSYHYVMYVSHDLGASWDSSGHGLDSGSGASMGQRLIPMPDGSMLFPGVDGIWFRYDEQAQQWERYFFDSTRGAKPSPRVASVFPDGRILCTTNDAGIYVTDLPAVAGIDDRDRTTTPERQSLRVMSTATDDVVRIELEMDRKMVQSNVAIYDLLGSQIEEITLQRIGDGVWSGEISIRSYATGFYLVTTSIDGEVCSGSFIKGR